MYTVGGPECKLRSVELRNFEKLYVIARDSSNYALERKEKGTAGNNEFFDTESFFLEKVTQKLNNESRAQN